MCVCEREKERVRERERDLDEERKKIERREGNVCADHTQDEVIE